MKLIEKYELLGKEVEEKGKELKKARESLIVTCPSVLGEGYKIEVSIDGDPKLYIGTRAFVEYEDGDVELNNKKGYWNHSYSIDIRDWPAALKVVEELLNKEAE